MGGGMAHTETFDPKRYTPFEKGIKSNDVLSTFPQIDTKVDHIKFSKGLERLASVMDRFHLLKYGLSLILVFVGLKMLGEIVPGMRRIREARAAQPDRIPAEIVGDALLYAMRRDFAAAASVWRETLQSEEELPHSKAMLCLAVDSFLESGDLSAAWKSCQDFLSLPVPQSRLPTATRSRCFRRSPGADRCRSGYRRRTSTSRPRSAPCARGAATSARSPASSA